MANSFGEIVHPSSRAFWNEDDDEDDTIGTNNSPKFTLEWTEVSPQKIKTLIVAESPSINGFMTDYVLENAENICDIRFSGSKNPSGIFRITNDLYACIVSTDVDLKLAAEFVESIYDVLIRSEHIIAMTCNHISQMKTFGRSLKSCSLKSLSTKSVPEAQKKFPLTLKQPNIVSGVSAGVVAYAEAMDFSATLCVLYMDGLELDSETARPIINLFEKHVGLTTAEFTSRENTSSNKGNLYL